MVAIAGMFASNSDHSVRKIAYDLARRSCRYSFDCPRLPFDESLFVCYFENLHSNVHAFIPDKNNKSSFLFRIFPPKLEKSMMESAAFSTHELMKIPDPWIFTQLQRKKVDDQAIKRCTWHRMAIRGKNKRSMAFSNRFRRFG